MDIDSLINKLSDAVNESYKREAQLESQLKELRELRETLQSLNTIVCQYNKELTDKLPPED